MSQPEQTKRRRWIGYLCPTCGAVFRLESGNAGRRALCPHCDAILVVPDSKSPTEGGDPAPGPPEPAAAPAPRRRKSPAKSSAPRKASAVRRDEAEPPSDEEAQETRPMEFRKAEPLPEGAELRMRKKMRFGEAGQEQEPDWEKPLVKRRSMPPRAMIAIVLGGLLAALLGAGAILFPNRKRPAVDPDADAGFSVAPVILPEARETETGLEKFVDLDLEVALVRIEETVTAFFQATTVEELSKVVRGGDTTAERMRAYYQDRPIHPVGLRTVAENGELQTAGPLSSVYLVLEDYSRRAIAVEQVGDRLLIDWESWVGWSEMEWEDLMREKPTEPVLMRVRRSMVDYYNFHFSDDWKWRSFRLESHDRKSTVYGYAPRHSVLEQQLSPEPGNFAAESMIVRVRYPVDATRGDQVLIDSFVTNGWVLDSE